MKKIILLAFFVVAGVILIRVLTNGKQIIETPPAMQVQKTEVVKSEQKNDGKNDAPKEKIKKFSITAKRFSYTPNPMEVNLGDKVVIEVESHDVPHSFTLSDFKNLKGEAINEFLQLGEKKTIEFIADKKGEFVFGCDVACGKDHDKMLGKLIVR